MLLPESKAMNQEVVKEGSREGKTQIRLFFGSGVLKGKRAITDFSPQRYREKSSPKLQDIVGERFSDLQHLWMSMQGEAEGEMLSGLGPISSPADCLASL